MTLREKKAQDRAIKEAEEKKRRAREEVLAFAASEEAAGRTGRAASLRGQFGFMEPDMRFGFGN